jgi:hypothetical protein
MVSIDVQRTKSASVTAAMTEPMAEPMAGDGATTAAEDEWELPVSDLHVPVTVTVHVPRELALWFNLRFVISAVAQSCAVLWRHVHGWVSLGWRGVSVLRCNAERGGRQPLRYGSKPCTGLF